MSLASRKSNDDYTIKQQMFAVSKKLTEEDIIVICEKLNIKISQQIEDFFLKNNGDVLTSKDLTECERTILFSAKVALSKGNKLDIAYPRRFSDKNWNLTYSSETFLPIFLKTWALLKRANFPVRGLYNSTDI